MIPRKLLALPFKKLRGITRTGVTDETGAAVEYSSIKTRTTNLENKIESTITILKTTTRPTSNYEANKYST